jgi:zinc protease
VGDVDPTQAIDAVARTFGALPARAASDPYAEQRKVAFPPKTFAVTARFEGPPSVAVVTLAWPAPEPLEKFQRRQGEILADVFAARLETKLRDELGDTYSPSASFAWSDSFSPACVHLSCAIEVAPERAEAIMTAARDVAEKLARDGMTAEEFERGRRPRVRDAEASQRDNAWWLGTLAKAQSIPGSAESGVRAVEHYRAATLDELNALAKRILVKERECQLLVMPKQP